jgi:hypothetical protein
MSVFPKSINVNTICFKCTKAGVQAATRARLQVMLGFALNSLPWWKRGWKVEKGLTV